MPHREEVEIVCKVCGKRVWVEDTKSATFSMPSHKDPRNPNKECDGSYEVVPRTSHTKKS